MEGCCFYTAGSSPALPYAADRLTAAGCRFTPEITQDTTHLLLPIPSLDKAGNIRGGATLQSLLQKLPRDICLIGGNLPTDTGFRTLDLLQDPVYVAENAYITAHCAIRLAMNKLPRALRGCKILVIGWGRIGKCLAALLKGLEAQVTVAARKEADRGMLQALGYCAISTDDLSPDGYQIIFNTVPVMVLPQCPETSLNIDLASAPGLGGSNIIHARGLPAQDAPEASGGLIARRILHHICKEGIQ